jgi:hypothetical protein
MASESGPKFVTDGLVLCLDAANPRSYISGATVWNDLTYNASGGTLTNGPTFSSVNGGSIVFDGTDDYVFLQSGNPGIQFPGDMSMEVFFKLTSYSLTIWNNVITKWDGVAGNEGNNDWHFSIKDSGGGAYKQNIYTGISSPNADLYGNQNILLNQWYSCCFTLVNGVLLSMYVNGVLDNTHVNVSRTNNSSSLRIGDPRNTFGVKNGLIAKVQIYNRALSASEVLQNYNAIKSRFGL